MELEPGINFRPVHDRRPLIPEPPPVKLVTVEDARLPASAGLERELNAFYIDLLKFERDERTEGVDLPGGEFSPLFRFDGRPSGSRPSASAGR